MSFRHLSMIVLRLKYVGIFPIFYRVSLWLLATLISFYMSPAAARLVDDVTVRELKQGYEVRINFRVPVRYISHSPEKTGKVLQIQVRPVENGGGDIDLQSELEALEILSWDREIGLPIKDMTFEGDDPNRPRLTLRFSEHLRFSVRSSADLRSIIVTFLVDHVRHRAPAPARAAVPLPTTPSAPSVRAQDMLPAVPEKRIAALMEDAADTMTRRDYHRAIELYTKILRYPDHKYRRKARELLGLAYERNNQLAHAKAEYDTYLRNWPKGEASDRVRQRLAAMLTVHARPKTRRAAAPAARRQRKTAWRTDVYGSFSQFYNRDKTSVSATGGRLNRSDVTTDLDFNARMRNKNYDVRVQFVGGHVAEFLSGGSDESRITTMSVQLADKKHNLYARIGRQSSRNTGGVLGRYDGVLLRYRIAPKIRLNAVAGFPVDSTTDKNINSERRFIGVSADLGDFADYWNFNIFAINQTAKGVVDRRAVGGELRYADPTKSLFTLVDYDISYNDLNLFLMVANWTLPSTTTINLVLDYRNSPILTTTNALQGQGVATLRELFGLFAKDQIRQLAVDRTTVSKSATLSITQPLNETFQLSGEVTASHTSASVASGGVEANPSTGTETFYTLQLISSDLIRDGSISILGLRFSDTQNNTTTSATLNTRVPITRNFRINPRLRIDYRRNKTDGGSRWTVRPLVRVDYRWRRRYRLEMELGYEWLNDHFASAMTTNQITRGYFLFIGYRAEF